MAKGNNILLIDDDDELVETLTTVLESKNYNVSRASNGKSGIEMIRKTPPDLIVLDIMMDTINDGIETAQKIKKNSEWKNIPIIMLTNVNQEFPMNISGDEDYLPVELFLEKPLDPDTFLSEIKKLI